MVFITLGQIMGRRPFVKRFCGKPAICDGTFLYPFPTSQKTPFIMYSDDVALTTENQKPQVCNFLSKLRLQDQSNVVSFFTGV